LLILTLFRTHVWLTAPLVHRMLTRHGFEYSLRSTQRFIADMTRTGMLVVHPEDPQPSEHMRRGLNPDHPVVRAWVTGEPVPYPTFKQSVSLSRGPRLPLQVNP